MDRTGFVRGTLAPRTGMTAPVPAVDKPEPLTMEDMMGDMVLDRAQYRDQAVLLNHEADAF